MLIFFASSPQLRRDMNNIRGWSPDPDPASYISGADENLPGIITAENFAECKICAGVSVSLILENYGVANGKFGRLSNFPFGLPRPAFLKG
jgi:hypothetical protein